jgi:hypothetical protein
MDNWGGLYNGGHGIACNSVAKGEASSKAILSSLKSLYHMSSWLGPSYQRYLWRCRYSWCSVSCAMCRISSSAPSIFFCNSDNWSIFPPFLHLLVYDFKVADLLIHLLILWGWASRLPFWLRASLKRISSWLNGWYLEEQEQPLTPLSSSEAWWRWL